MIVDRWVDRALPICLGDDRWLSDDAESSCGRAHNLGGCRTSARHPSAEAVIHLNGEWSNVVDHGVMVHRSGRNMQQNLTRKCTCGSVGGMKRVDIVISTCLVFVAALTANILAFSVHNQDETQPTPCECAQSVPVLDPAPIEWTIELHAMAHEWSDRRLACQIAAVASTQRGRERLPIPLDVSLADCGEQLMVDAVAGASTAP